MDAKWAKNTKTTGGFVSLTSGKHLTCFADDLIYKKTEKIIRGELSRKETKKR